MHLIADIAARSDVVVNAADSDDLELALAINARLKRRFESQIGERSLLIHTSGTALAIDEADGSFKEDQPIFNVNAIYSF